MCAEPQCNKYIIASWQGELKAILRAYEPNSTLSCGDLSESYSKGQRFTLWELHFHAIMYCTFLKNTTCFLSKILHIFEKSGSARSPFQNKRVGEGCIETKGSGSRGSLAYSAAESKNKKQTHNF